MAPDQSDRDVVSPPNGQAICAFVRADVKASGWLRALDKIVVPALFLTSLAVLMSELSPCPKRVSGSQVVVIPGRNLTTTPPAGTEGRDGRRTNPRFDASTLASG